MLRLQIDPADLFAQKTDTDQVLRTLIFGTDEISSPFNILAGARGENTMRVYFRGR